MATAQEIWSHFQGYPALSYIIAPSIGDRRTVADVFGAAACLVSADDAEDFTKCLYDYLSQCESISDPNRSRLVKILEKVLPRLKESYEDNREESSLPDYISGQIKNYVYVAEAVPYMKEFFGLLAEVLGKNRFLGCLHQYLAPPLHPRTLTPD